MVSERCNESVKGGLCRNKPYRRIGHIRPGKYTRLLDHEDGLMRCTKHYHEWLMETMEFMFGPDWQKAITEWHEWSRHD